jgi:hypothetical protein
MSLQSKVDVGIYHSQYKEELKFQYKGTEIALAVNKEEIVTECGNYYCEHLKH